MHIKGASMKMILLQRNSTIHQRYARTRAMGKNRAERIQRKNAEPTGVEVWHFQNQIRIILVLCQASTRHAGPFSRTVEPSNACAHFRAICKKCLGVCITLLQRGQKTLSYCTAFTVQVTLQ